MEEEKKSNNISSRQWVDLLASYFNTIKEHEDKIESLRIALNQQNNFSVKSLFDHLDNNSKNFLTLDDFIKFLQNNSINYDESNIRQFIHNYDKDNDFRINYQEFKGIILPLTDESFRQKEEEKEQQEREQQEKELQEKELQEKEKQEKDKQEKEVDNNIKEDEKKNDIENQNEEEMNSNINNNVDNLNNKKDNQEEPKDDKKQEKEQIDQNILNIFGEILSEEMTLAEKNRENAKNIMNSKSFTFYEGFIEIADEDNYITEENLNNFLKKNGNELEIKDMKGLIHRIDTDNDGKISYPEFKEIFYPTSTMKYKSSLDDYNKYQNDYNSIYNSNKYNLNNNSSYSPYQKNDYLGNSYNNKNNSYYNPDTYKSPILRNSPSSLNYNYSNKDPDVDNDLYRTRPKNRNSSVISNRNSKPLYNSTECDKLYKRNCCGCPLYTMIVHCNNCCCCLCCRNPCLF
jgi:Ca2+-binding EF-hand superfamily protein